MHAKDGTPRHRRRCRGVSRYTLCAVALHAIRLTGSSSSALRCGGEKQRDRRSLCNYPANHPIPRPDSMPRTPWRPRAAAAFSQGTCSAASLLQDARDSRSGRGRVGGIEPVAEGAARRPGRRAGRMGWAREGNEGRSQVLGGCFCCALPTIRPSSSMSPETIPLIEGAGWQVDMMRDLLLIL